jgi:hypothetical protein
MNKKTYVPVLIIILLISVLALPRIKSTLGNDKKQPTSTLHFISTSTQTPMVMEKLTESPTIMSTQPIMSLEDMIKTNGNCNLPCFWGIRPGITKWTEAMDLFSQLDIEGVIGTSPRDFKYFTANVEAKSVAILLNLYQKDDIVGAILLTISNKPPLTGSHPDIEPYSIKKTFMNLGMPTDILLKLDFAPEGPSEVSSYSFWVTYDNYGLQENYIGSLENPGDSKVCPEETSKQVTLYLYSPTLDFVPWGPDISGDAEKIENVTSITATDFFQLSINSDTPVCLETKQ